MRLSIKLIAAGITIAIFILLNYYWVFHDEYLKYMLLNPGTFTLDDVMLFYEVSYWIPFIVILVSMIAIAYYFYVKSRQKTRIKL